MTSVSTATSTSSVKRRYSGPPTDDQVAPVVTDVKRSKSGDNSTPPESQGRGRSAAVTFSDGSGDVNVPARVVAELTAVLLNICAAKTLYSTFPWQTLSFFSTNPNVLRFLEHDTSRKDHLARNPDHCRVCCGAVKADLGAKCGRCGSWAHKLCLEDVSYTCGTSKSKKSSLCPDCCAVFKVAMDASHPLERLQAYHGIFRNWTKLTWSALRNQC